MPRWQKVVGTAIFGYELLAIHVDRLPTISQIVLRRPAVGGGIFAVLFMHWREDDR